MAPKAEARGLIIATSRPRRLCWSGIGCPGHSEDWKPSECPPCSLPRHPLATLTLSSLLHPWRMASHEPLIAQASCPHWCLLCSLLGTYNLWQAEKQQGKVGAIFEIHGTPKISSTGSTRFMAEIRNNPSVLSTLFSAKNSLGSTREFFAAQVWRESTYIYTYEIHRTKKYFQAIWWKLLNNHDPSWTSLNGMYMVFQHSYFRVGFSNGSCRKALCMASVTLGGMRNLKPFPHGQTNLNTPACH